MIDTEIEVFRAGTAAARGITAEQLAEVASYDCAEKPVGLCFGHPKSDTPAAGTIKAFRAEGNSLFARIGSLTDKAIEGIKSGEWLDRSMAFFDPTHEANPRPGKWSPRHVGLLGASAPGIPGMTSLRKALAFDADGGLTADGAPADAIVYAGTPTTVHTVFEAKEPEMNAITSATGLTAEALDAREKAAAAREEAHAKRVRAQFEASNSSSIDALVAAGKVLPAEAGDLKLAFNSLDPEADPLTFGAGDNAKSATAVSSILSFMATALPKRVPLGDRVSPEGEPGPTEYKTPAEFNAAATKLAKDKGLTFEAAAEELLGENA